MLNGYLYDGNFRLEQETKELAVSFYLYLLYLFTKGNTYTFHMEKE